MWRAKAEMACTSVGDSIVRSSQFCECLLYQGDPQGSALALREAQGALLVCKSVVDSHYPSTRLRHMPTVCVGQSSAMSISDCNTQLAHAWGSSCLDMQHNTVQACGIPVSCRAVHK